MLQHQPLSTIQGAFYTYARSVQNVRVNHRRRDVFVAQEFLDRPDVMVCLQQVGKGNDLGSVGELNGDSSRSIWADLYHEGDIDKALCFYFKTSYCKAKKRATGKSDKGG